MSKVRLIIKGRVQGVSYRYYTREEAQSLGLSGWVRNLDNGCVEAEIVGPRETVERLIQWCRKGPPHARVDGVEEEWLDEDGAESHHRFVIR
jgi:acylphosphatase